MTRNEDGGVTLKMPVFIAIISACLAVGSGGTWFASGQSQEIAVLQQSVASHHELDEGRNARQDAEIKALQEQLEKMDKKLDLLLARR